MSQIGIGNGPRPFKPEFFEAVGRLCAAWAYLELRIEQKIWEVRGLTPEDGRKHTYNFDMQKLWFDMLDAMKEVEHSDFAALNSKSGDAVTMARERNIAVHGRITWGFLLDSPGWQMTRGPHAGQIVPATIEFITDLVQRVQKLAELISGPKKTLGPS